MGAVRLARLGDVEAIGRVHTAAWQAGYRGQMPDEFLDSLDPVEAASRWQETLSRTDGSGTVRSADGDHTVLVIEDETGELVGVASVGAERQGGQGGELWMINLAPKAWGKGLGRELLAAATETLRSLGHDEAILWVLDTNTRAQHFYESAGWVADGAVKLDDRRGFTLRELRYRKAIS